MVFYANKYDYITSLLKTLQWLSILFREKAERTLVCVRLCVSPHILGLSLLRRTSPSFP